MKITLLKTFAALLTLSAIVFSPQLLKSQADDLQSHKEPPAVQSIEESLFGPDLSDAFFYDLGPRFGGIAKSKLQRAEKLEDFLDPDFHQNVKSYQRIEMRRIDQEGKHLDPPVIAEGGLLNEAQKNFLQSLDYDHNLYLSIDCYEYYQQSEKATFQTFTPHLTVIPEQVAQYKEGKEALVKTIREQHYPYVAGLNRQDLQPAKMYLLINANGELESIELDRGSGHPQADLELVKFLKQTEKDWIPARNSEGKAVAQTLVFFFGLPGC